MTALPEPALRRASSLMNLADLLWRRHLYNLEEPFELNLQELRLWRERVSQMEAFWLKLLVAARETLHDPAGWLISLDDADPERLEAGPFDIYREAWQRLGDKLEPSDGIAELQPQLEETPAERDETEPVTQEELEEEEEDLPTEDELFIERYRATHEILLTQLEDANQRIVDWMEDDPEQFVGVRRST